MSLSISIPILLATAQATADVPVAVTPARPASLAVAPGRPREILLTLRRGESADIAVLQQGVDVVVEAFSPAGRLIATIDSPNGRQGDEPVSLFADEAGRYRLRIRAISPQEPAGSVRVRVAEFRDAAATRRLLAARAQERRQAAAWLGRNNEALPADGRLNPAASLPILDRIASESRIVGIGEATHGSREFADFRLALIKRLVERHGFRIVAVEGSSSRWRALEDYVSGRTSQADAGARSGGWIGTRAVLELIAWTRQWNLAHPEDRVRIVGLDAQDNAQSREDLRAFLQSAYGAALSEAAAPHLAALAAADERAAVFADSTVAGEQLRFFQQLAWRIGEDEPILASRFGDGVFRRALAAARDLAAFADFNSGRGPMVRSRDWYMATGIVRALEESSGSAKAVFWGHNSHVSAAPTSWGPTGALLRQVFGCAYRAVATTFGRGGFVAQVPGDPQNRLRAVDLPPADEQTIEGVLAQVRAGAHLSAWTCGAQERPVWLQTQRPLRWVGALYAPDSPPSASYQPYAILNAFDAIAYFPAVAAEPVPAANGGRE